MKPRHGTDRVPLPLPPAAAGSRSPPAPVGSEGFLRSFQAPAACEWTMQQLRRDTLRTQGSHCSIQQLRSYLYVCIQG